MKQIQHILQKNRRRIVVYAVIWLAVLLTLFLFFNLVKAVVVILLFIAGNTLLRFYRRIFPGIPVELELVILGGVVCTLAFNIWAGLLVVLFASLCAEFFSQAISPYSFINIFSYLSVPFLSLMLPATSIASGGFLIAVFVNIVIYAIFIYIGYDWIKNTAYLITNIFWNYLLFIYVAPALLILL